MMRRIMLLVTVVALMVVMLAMSVAPAFAGHLYRHGGHGPTYTCVRDNFYWRYGVTPKDRVESEKLGFECTRDP